MVKVLQELVALDAGGIEKLLYDYYCHMDHQAVKFDFVIYENQRKGRLEDRLEEMGCTVFHVPQPKKHLPAYLKAIRGIIRDGGYNVIHCHHAGHSVVALYYARKYHVPKRIAHAHTAIPNMRIAKKVYNLVLDTFAARFSTQLMACGHLAGECHWGKKATQRGLIRVMPNAIETERFRFSAIERERFRKAFGVEESFVIGTVARICDQKNYPMMLNIVKSVLEKTRKAFLLLSGTERLRRLTTRSDWR